MRIPDFVELREERAECKSNGTGAFGTSSARRVHPNPRFYKYYWWIFWNESPVDGRAFLADQYRLNTAAAIQLMDQLDKLGEPYWIYNEQVRRLGSTIPYDPQSPKLRDIEWAPAYDDDPDPMASHPLSEHK